MADTILAKRKEQKLTQEQLANMTGIHRGMLSRLESRDYIPSIEQLQRIAEVLGFEVTDLFMEEPPAHSEPAVCQKYNIAVAGTGYVGLSIATLLAQHNHVTAVDILPEKVALINQRKSPFRTNISKHILQRRSWISLPPSTEKRHTGMLISLSSLRPPTMTARKISSTVLQSRL